MGTTHRRRSREETRALVLDAALGLVRERAEASGPEVVAAALAHVRLTDVAARAGVTTGAIYPLWPSQSEFQADLLLHVAHVQAQLRPGLTETVDRLRAAAAAGTTFGETVRAVATRAIEDYAADPLFRVELGFLVGARDARVLEALQHRREAFIEVAAQAWSALLEVHGRQVRPPRTVSDLTVAAAATIVGAVVLGHADAPDVTGLAAATVVELFETWTQDRQA